MHPQNKYKTSEIEHFQKIVYQPLKKTKISIMASAFLKSGFFFSIFSSGAFAAFAWPGVYIFLGNCSLRISYFTLEMIFSMMDVFHIGI